ncbi:MAG TPA: amino acid adenylation domain-containing protein [Candidatus Polarisedimenticolaceae bacterium]|nr:amino acid adenylation domain-containing protein [Candidatus Polarisedimenticolaceae bacterium]
MNELRRRELVERLLREQLGEAWESIEPISRWNRDEPIPLSFAQQRLWFLDQLEPQSPAYNIPLAIRLRGMLDAAALERALDEMVRRHETLRTSLPAEGGQPRQHIAADARLPLARIDLRAVAAGDREAALSRLAREQARRPFDLTRGPLWRLVLVVTADDAHALLVTMHHAIADGWSMGVFVRELAALYDAFRHGRPSGLAELPLQYVDYALWQRRQLSGERLERLLAHWRGRLSDPPPPPLLLPTDRPRPAAQTSAGAYRLRTLPRSLVERIAALGRREGVTPFMTLLAAFKVLLLRHTGQTDIVVGTPIANRSRTETEGLIGCFANTLALRTDLSGNPRFVELLARVRETTLDAYAHQDLPFEKLVEELRPERDRSRTPLFQVAFVLQNAPVPELELGGLAVTIEELDSGTAKFDLTLCLAESEDGLLASLEYNTDLFEEATAERLLQRFGLLLEGIAADPHARLRALPLLAPEERQWLLGASNAGAAELVVDDCLHRRFERIAAACAGETAVVCGDESLSYGELDRRANALAHRLRALGVGPESLVGLFTERSVEMVVAILGILKAGGAYVPLDRSYPEQRRAWILEDSRVSVVVAERALLDGLPDVGRPVILLDAEPSDVTPAPVCVDVASASTAYVIYTSGSTGRPKGVPVSHGNVLRLFEATASWFRFNAADVWTLFHSYAFDFSVWELWGALLHGGRVVVVPRETSRDPAAFHALLRRERVTVLSQTPSFFRQLLRADEASRADLTGLRWVIFGGEALEPQSLRPWFARYGDRRPVLVNMYGITETTVHVSYRPLGAADLAGPARSVLGVAIPDLEVYVLDEDLELAPIGVPGEICVGGAGLSRGYLGDPARTAERFVPDPFGSRPGGRLYRSGDLARRLPDGDLEYLGRIDQQLKIRGSRVEPGEIEAALDEHPGVRESCVTAAVEPDGQPRLVAHLVAARGTSLKVEELRSFLQARVPAYMIPAAIVVLDALPLTVHGKVDRLRLPAPPRSRPDLEREFVPPRGGVEDVLAGLWSEVLGIDRPGTHDNFFTLGGDSIRSIQLVARARQHGLELSVAALFEHQTIAEQARYLERPDARGAEPASLAADAGAWRGELRRLPEGIEEAYPLSRLQHGFVYHGEQSADYVIYTTSVLLQAPFDRGVLQEAIDRAVRRHAMLRTSFDLTHHGEPMQLVHRELAVALGVEDLRALGADEQHDHVSAWLAAELRRRFDWSEPPLVRFQVHRRGADTFQFTISEPFLDGWSVATLLTELFEDYLRRLGGAAPVELRAPRSSYRDFVELERQALGSVATRGYWDGQLAGFTAGALPREAAAAAAPQEPAAVGRVEVPLPEPVSAGLLALARADGVPLKNVLLAAHLKVLAATTGRTDVITGLIQNGRPERDDGEQVLGLFLNTVPLRLKLERESWRELVRRCFAAEVAALPHRRFPLAELQRLHGPQPLFDTCFNYTNFHVYDRLSGVAGLEVLDYVGSEQTYFALTTQFNLDHEAQRVSLALDFRSQDLSREQVERIGERYATVLRALASEPAAPHDACCVLSTAERQRVLATWSGAAAAPAPAQTVHGRIEAQAARTPHALAVIHGSERRTYAELNARANRLARHLRERGVGPDALVGVCLERNVDLVVALLAILKAGGAYVPLDPAYPRERLAFTLEDSAMPVIVTDERLAAILPPHRAELVRLDTDAAAIARKDPGDLRLAVEPEQLAYVLYTSGSTGRPKGAALCHGGVVAMLRWADDAYSDAELRGVLASTSLCFDPSVLEIFLPLSRGGAVIVANNVLELPALAARDEVTLLSTVSSAIDELLRVGGVPDSVRTVNLAGEPLRTSLVQRIYAHGIERVWNLYGLTEDSVYSTAALVPPAETYDFASIGRPVPGTRLYLLDAFLQPVPPGTPGEIHIGGAGLPRGYLNRPEQTAEKFVPDPFAASPGARLHRTGDLARFRPDGTLEFLARIDHQVKVRGFRIELGEVETALAGHPGVRQAVATVREDEPGERVLVAYLVPSGEPLAVGTLREFLQERLPDFMLPSAFVWLDGLPLTPNGKLDRRRLPAPQREGFAGRPAHLAPRTPVEQLLAAIWERTLRVPRVGVHDNFFELGGHSLSATQIVSRARDACGVELPLRALFEAPTIAGLAQRVEALRRVPGTVAAAPLAAREHQGELPLSFSQQRLWFLDQLEPHNPFYNVPVALRLGGELDRDALERACTEILRRHEALRTTFPAERGRPRQRIAPAGPLPLCVEDLSAWPEAEREAHVRRHVAAETMQPFDLARGPLLRAALLRVGPADHVLLLTMHHIVADGWSIGVLLHELGELYAAFTRGLPSPLRELAVQYADYSIWQREWLQGAALETQLGYWRERLAGAPSILELPGDFERPPRISHRGAQHDFELSVELTQALVDLARREGVTLFMLLLAAFDVLLQRISGQEDVVVGTPIANRTRSELEGLIGFFVNTLVLRVGLSGDPTFSELLRRVRDVALEAYAHQDLPFEQLVEALEPRRDLSRTPLFSVLFDLHNEPLSLPTLEGLTVAGCPEHTGTAKFDLALTWIEGADGLAGSIEYRTELFAGASIERMVRQLTTLLQAIAGDPERPISRLPLLSAAERLDELAASRGRPLPSPGDHREVLDLFAEQVARQPRAPAVACGRTRLSYAELAERAAALAAALRERGVGLETPVAVRTAASVDTVVALLAVLRAGGAYVPLDPAHPEARQEFTLGDARPALLLEPGSQLDSPADSALPTGPLPGERMAYVLYTSGSTGQPKGVVVSQRNLFDSTRARLGYYGERAERFLLVPSFAFDSSMAGLFWTLACGGELHLLEEGERAEPRRIVEAIATARITHMLLLPALYARVLEEAAARQLDSLRVVVVAGETCPATLVSRHRAVLPATALFNEYGPTEGTVWASVSATDDTCSRRSVPIGSPVDGVHVYLLDARLGPVPRGVVGEVYLGGTGVARGYLGRPDATAERFVPDPWGRGTRLYRTGDLARRLPGGQLEFVGRNDLQVKLRGYRIEPQEVEHALRAHPAVRDCAVRVWDDHLVGYLTSRGEAMPSPGELRDYLRRCLPSYMVPSVWVALNDLPRTATGKLDRAALPRPERDRSGVEASYVAPRTPIEEVIVGIWSEVLDVPQIGVEDDFFALGGHSLTATQVLSRMRELFEVDLQLRLLFEAPTVGAFSRALVAAAGPDAGIEETSRLVLRLAAMPEEEVARRIAATHATEHDREIVP